MPCRGWQRIVLAGVGDLGEIATLCAAELPVELVGFCDPDATVTRFAGLPVAHTLDELTPFDAVMVTDFRNPQATFDALSSALPSDRVVAPKLLRISREMPTLAE